MLEAAANTKEPSFFPEFTIRHPENDNAVLLWHGSASLSLKDPKSEIKMVPPWVLKNLPATNVSFKLKDGPLTVCRFENLKNGEYFSRLPHFFIKLRLKLAFRGHYNFLIM